MIINLSTINFDETGSGGGGTPARLQNRTVGIVANGMRNIMPTGYDGMAEVTINTAISGETSALDFYQIGYDYNLNEQLNAKINEPLNYSKSLYDAWNPSNTSAYDLYYNNQQLVYAPNIDTSNVTDMRYMFQDCTNLTTVPLLNTSNVTNMYYVFGGSKKLTTVPLFDTSKATTMGKMFKDCSNLTTVPLFDTSKVTNMESMFNNCTNLTTVPLFDTSKVTNMESMFNNCTNLTTVPLFDTSKVTNMNRMFSYCINLTTVPAFDTSNMTGMFYMFEGCYNLTSLPLFDCGKLTNISDIFSSNDKLTTLGGFKDLKISWTDYGGLVKLPNLTYQSVMNVINNLYDFRGNGDSTTTKTIRFNSNSLNLLSDADKSIATNKGWILTS